MRRNGTHTPHRPTVFTHGGKRPGAGRKPKGAVAMAPHGARPRVSRHDRVLVTTQLLPGLPDPRRERTLDALRRALAAGADRSGFRLVEHSIQPSQLHFLAEGDDARAFSRGLQGLLVRVARTLNREWGRSGTVFADRYRARVLGSPRAARSALERALQEAREAAHASRSPTRPRRGRGPPEDSTASRARSARSRAPVSAPG